MLHSGGFGVLHMLVAVGKRTVWVCKNVAWGGIRCDCFEGYFVNVCEIVRVKVQTKPQGQYVAVGGEGLLKV